MIAATGLTRRIARFAPVAVLVACLMGVAIAGSARQGIATAAPASLIADGGFENGSAAWKFCGGAGRESVAGAGFSARLGYPTTPDDCPPPMNSEAPVRQALYQQFTVPAAAQGLTVQFSYYVDGLSQTDLDVRLVPDLYSYTFDQHAVYLDPVRALESPGWVTYRKVLSLAEFTKARGQTLLLVFVFPSMLITYHDLDAPQTFRIDDVSIVPAEVRTTASRRPAALRGDGSRPVAFLRIVGSRHELWRMDGNGRNAARIYRGLHEWVYTVDWSPDGQRIAVGEYLVVEQRGTSLLSVIDPNGGGQIPLRILPIDPLNTNFVYDYTYVAWSPDGRRIAASKLAHEYYGDISNASIDVVNVKTRRSKQIFVKADHADWSVTNRLVYHGHNINDAGNDLGLWEANMRVARPKGTRIVRGTTQATDTEPAWSPDGRRFVSIRPTSVIQRDIPIATARRGLMLYERAKPAEGRMILFADHGVISGPAWSADGKFILYNLTTDFGTDIWWLELATGKTGPLTYDGRSYNANWRPE